MRPEAETPEEKEARIKRNADRARNKFVHDTCLQLSKTLMIVEDRNIDVGFVNWKAIQDSLRRIEQAVDDIGGAEDSPKRDTFAAIT